MSETDLLRTTRAAYDMIFKGTVDFFSIKAAFDLGLFKALAAGPQDLECLAQTTRSVPKRLEKFLLGLEQCKLVERQDHLWALSPLSKQFFVPTDPPSNLTMVPFVDYIASTIENYYMHLAEVVRGERNFTSFTPYPPRTREDSVFYETLHRSNVHFPIQLLLERGNFAGVRHLIDVGGGIGDIVAAICEKYPELNVTLLNLPSALDLVRENVEARGLGGRIEAVAVDMNREPYPQGDGVLISRILYPFNAQVCKMYLQKAYDALHPGGRIFVLDLIISDPENPNYDYLTHYLGSVGTDFVVMGFKNHAVYGDLLREIGFEQVHCDEAYDHVLFQAAKPQV